MNDPGASTSTPMLTEIVLPGIVGPEGLNIHQRPVPTPGKGQALVEVLATGVSFAEQQMRRGRYLNQPKFPFVLGYDLVGVVAAVGPQVDESLVGRRVAAVVKTGGWATHALVVAGHLVPVPDGLDAAEAETVVLNGITAWQMLKKAKVDSGQTILVHGANGGVGTPSSSLHATLASESSAPRHHDALRAMGAEPIDYNDPHLADRARQFAAGGLDAVFDQIGGPSFERSFKLLARGGILVAYGTASQRDDTNNVVASGMVVYSRLGVWSLIPNGRRALFYNFWEGKVISPKRFWRRLATDLSSVFSLLAEGAITPPRSGPHASGRGRLGDDPSRIQDGIRQGRSGPMNLRTARRFWITVTPGE
jgi:NADPH:quinone reductase-like Zn-dependent oxidoreductase